MIILRFILSMPSNFYNFVCNLYNILYILLWNPIFLLKISSAVFVSSVDLEVK